MSTKGKEAVVGSKKSVARCQSSSRSLDIASKGVTTGSQFASLMSALMTDLIEGAITPAIGNATCNAGGKLLKVVELQYKYGKPVGDGNFRILQLTEGTEKSTAR